MFVSESLSDILKPKSKEEFANLSVDKKEDQLLALLGREEGDLIWLEDMFHDDTERIWDSIIDIVYNSGYAPEDESGNYEEIDENWLRENLDMYSLVEFFVNSLTEKQLDKALSELVPGYMSESLKDVLKPKSQKEVKQHIEELKDEEKEDLLRNRGLGEFYGDYSGFMDFIQDFIPSIWERIRDIINYDEDSDQLSLDEIKWIPPSDLVDFALVSLSNDEMDMLLKKLIPGY
jgi:hypothetical protein